MSLSSEQPIRPPGELRGIRPLEEFSRDVRRSIIGLYGRGSEEETLPTFGSPYCPLTPLYLRAESGQWKVQFRPGYVYELFPHTSGAGPLTEFEIYIGATALSAATAPDLDVDLGDIIYLHWETDDHGAIKEISAGISAQIVALASAQDSTYHVLPDGTGSNGTDGSYYLKLATVDTVDTKAGWRGNFFWLAGWDALENVGSGEKIYKEYDISGDNKQLRTLIERASSPQINLSQVGDDEIRIEGNNKDGSLSFVDCSAVELYKLSWEDGLITNSGAGTIIIPPCEYNATAQTYFLHTEFSDGFTFSGSQKEAISDFFDATDSASVTDKLTGIYFMGTNELTSLRNAVSPGTVYSTWTMAPVPGDFSTGFVEVDGETGSMNRTPAEMGMSNTSGTGFLTVTDAPRTGMTMLNSYNSSNTNFQIKQDTGEFLIRNGFSVNAKGSNEEQNGVFVGSRDGSAVTCVNVTGGGGYSKTSTTTTYSRSGGYTATNDIALFDSNCDFNISIIGTAEGLSQAEAEALASALYDCAIGVGHTAIAST